MTSAAAPALHAAVPRLAAGVPWVGLGAWPTPIEPLGEDLWVKREDRTAPRYGGNKVRTLEAMLGRARAAGATRIWATGAYGCAEEYDMERHVRDMTCLPIVGGSSNMQRNNIANRLRLAR